MKGQEYSATGETIENHVILNKKDIKLEERQRAFNVSVCNPLEMFDMCLLGSMVTTKAFCNYSTTTKGPTQ